MAARSARAASDTAPNASAGDTIAGARRPIPFVPENSGAEGRKAAEERKGSMHTLTAVWRKWQAVDGARLAAALAFYSMLSLAPFLILVAAVAGWWLGSDAATQYLSFRAGELIGPGAARLVDRLVASGAIVTDIHRLGASIGTAVIVVGATAAYAELRHALNVIFGEVPRSSVRAVLRARALSFLLVLATGLVLVASLALSVGIAMFVNPETRILGFGASTIVNEIATFAVIALAFAAVLRVLPDRPPKGRHAWFGAIVSAGLFAIGKFAIGAYVSRYALHSPYGAAGTTVAIMLWMYFTAATFLAGAVITSVAWAAPSRAP